MAVVASVYRIKYERQAYRDGYARYLGEKSGDVTCPLGSMFETSTAMETLFSWSAKPCIVPQARSILTFDSSGISAIL